MRHEDPQLIDPADADDPNLLSFDLEGKAIPAPEITDDWEKERVEYSVQRYNLDFPSLMDKRKAVWNECWNRIQAYRQELALYQQDNHKNVIAKVQLKEAAKSVRELMKEERELSAVARACILHSGHPRVTRLLQSA